MNQNRNTIQNTKSGTSKISTSDQKSLLSDAEAFAQEVSGVETRPTPRAEVITAVSQETLAQSTPSVVNDVRDTVNSFLDKVAVAHMNKDYYIETSPDVFDHYMRGQKTEYFIYQGVRVYKYGTKDGIEEKESRTV